MGAKTARVSAISVLLFSSSAFVSSAFAVESAPHGEAHGGIHWGLLLWPTANFVIYLGLAIYIYKRYVRAALRSYSANVKTRMQRAKESLAEAEREERELESRLTMLEYEKRKVIEELEHEGERIAETIISQAQASAFARERETERQIKNELAQARAEVRSEMLSLALRHAREQLKSGLSAEQDRAIRQAALGGLFR